MAMRTQDLDRRTLIYKTLRDAEGLLLEMQAEPSSRTAMKIENRCHRVLEMGSRTPRLFQVEMDRASEILGQVERLESGFAPDQALPRRVLPADVVAERSKSEHLTLQNSV